MDPINKPALDSFMALETTDGLIDWLDEQFPERCADPGQPYPMIMVDTGKREVVRILRTFQAQRDEEIKEQNAILKGVK
jgi:hypothetical protein